MQAVRIHAYGPPEVLQLEEAPTPAPGAGQALVRVLAASVNSADIAQRGSEAAAQTYFKRLGLEARLPQTLGTAGVGVVEAVGEGVTNLRLGDRVAFAGPGAYAEYVMINARQSFPVLPGLSAEQAAAGLLEGWVAYELTHLAFPVKPGDWCLVQSATGGIGLLLVQLARLRGGRVIAVTSRAEKAPVLAAAGAEATLVAGQTDIAAEARRLAGGRGVAVVYDGLGQERFQASLDSLAPGGTLMLYGQLRGAVPPLDLATLQAKGSLFVSYNSGAAYFDRLPQYFQDLAGWIEHGTLSIRTEHTYPLAQAAQAHRDVEQQAVVGRALLIP